MKKWFCIFVLVLFGACSSSGYEVHIESRMNEEDAITYDYFVFDNVDLPDIQTPGACAKESDFFEVEDIDEDGRNEIGVLMNACASRYKSLEVFTYKYGQWFFVGSVNYDVGYPEPPLHERVVKVSKGSFSMREIMTDPFDSEAPPIDRDVLYEMH